MDDLPQHKNDEVKLEVYKPPHLRFVIIGAGVAHAFAALALRHAGHAVEVFELPELSHILGSQSHDINLTPNITGLFRRVGFNAEDFGAVPYRESKSAYGDLSNGKTPDVHRVQFPEDFPNPWQTCRYARLYNGLKQRSMSAKGRGLPVSWHHQEPLSGISVEEATFTSDNDSIHSADMLVLATSSNVLNIDSRFKSAIVAGRTVLLYNFGRLSSSTPESDDLTIEGAAALSALFPEDISVDVEPRLKLYQEIHQDRANLFKDSATPSKALGEKFFHDAFDHAYGFLHRQTLRASMFIRMPTCFGPCPGPRQNAFGQPRNAPPWTTTTAYMTFKTPKSYLSSLFQTPELSITNPGGWAIASFLSTKFENLEWLGGRGYNMFSFVIHEVKYVPQSEEFEKNEEGTKVRPVSGRFQTVVFENMADPIITGREELGFPKMFATLDDAFTSGGTEYSLKAGWQGTEFCHMSLKGLQPLPPAPYVVEQPMLHHRVVPSTREPRRSDAEYVTVSKSPFKFPGMQRTSKGSCAEIEFTQLEGAELDRAFPTLINVIKGLRKLRIGEILDCGVKYSP